MLDPAGHRTEDLATGRSAATNSSLRLRPGLTIESWLRLGDRLAHVSNASAWWLGDWLLYGEQAYGETYKEALVVTSLDYQTLRNYAWVARRYEPSRRRETLSFQHHAELAALTDPEQELWLLRAERQRWSRNELRRQVRSAREGNEAGRRRALMVRMSVGRDRERRWRDAAAMADQSLSEWIAAQVDAAADRVLLLECPGDGVDPGANGHVESVALR